ncbi:UDP-N-acetylmuramate dehydrogenase [Leptolyngbya sp. 15MV]|nr:UDP-N-acetylmuramate dehydrogenase [Leptolyngbya sp. 15MV]
MSPDPAYIRQNVLLSEYTTLGVGGPARFFAECSDENELTDLIRFGQANSLEVFILGGGSNLLVSDAGFDGLVVKLGIRGIEMCSTNGDKCRITASAGENWDEFVEFAVARGLAGIECLSGIPGLVGGTPIQNVGAYGEEVSDVVVSVRCFDRKTGRIALLSNVECGFAYRKSIFNVSERDRYVVISVTYDLTIDGSPKIVYKDLSEHFGDRRPSVAEVREAVLSIRRKKSMVIDPADPNSRSAGSFFKNPVVSSFEYERIKMKEGRDIPTFPVGPDLVKIPAAWLIENAGFIKGFRLGNAAISENHSLALVNRGGATAKEIIDLMNLIKHGVFERYSVELVPEPVFLGFTYLAFSA